MTDPPRFAPTPIPEALVIEAEELARRLIDTAEMMAQNIRYWAHPDQPPTCGVRVDPPEGGWGADAPGDPRVSAEEMIGKLKHALAAIEGHKTSEAREEIELMRLVFLAIWLIGRPPLPDPAEERRIWASVPRTPESAIAYALRSATGPTPGIMARLREPPLRDLLIEAVALKTGKATGRGRARSKAPRWLEPLFEVATVLGLAGTAGDAKAWADTLHNRGILPRRKAGARGASPKHKKTRGQAPRRKKKSSQKKALP